jgi:phosphoribosylamine--glycine ligase
LLETDLLDIAEACTHGRLKEIEIRWKQGAAVCVVLASRGYPEQAEMGKAVTVKPLPENMVCFHAGTSLEGVKIVTSGGRVLGLTAWADGLEPAVRQVYTNLHKVAFEGMQYRKDIAQRALQRTPMNRLRNGFTDKNGQRRE